MGRSGEGRNGDWRHGEGRQEKDEMCTNLISKTCFSVSGLRTSDFRLPSSVSGLPTSDFGLPTSDFRLLLNLIHILIKFKQSIPFYPNNMISVTGMFTVNI